MSSAVTAAFVDAVGDLVRRIGEPRAEGEQIALDLLEHRRQLRVVGGTSAARASPRQALSSSTSP